ncbi:MAG: cellulose biosynthesis protein BcsQ [Acetobacteraceae bacterium]
MPLVCFASPKGGVGKTTLAANVAGNIGQTGRRVVALDLDPQNTLRLHFGMHLHDGSGFTHRLLQRPDWRACLQSAGPGLSLLPYGATNLSDAMQLAAAVKAKPSILGEPVRDMLADPDILLVVDTSPGPSPFLAAIQPLIDLLIAVLLVDATSTSLIPAIDSGATFGKQGPDQAIAFVLNQYDPRTRLGAAIAQGASRHLGTRLVGMVHRDEHVAEAIAAQKLLATYAPGSQATHDLTGISEAALSRLPARKAPARSRTWTSWLSRHSR